MTELGLLADAIGINERTLRRAVAEGSIHAIRTSPRKLELSMAERRYVRHAWPLISALRRALRTEHNVRFALLFGSAARGTDTPLSDVDILVSMHDPSLDRVVELEAKLAARTGRRVDVVRLEDAEQQPSFLADIAAVGRVLVDRDGTWPPLRQREPSLRREARVRDARAIRTALARLDKLFEP